MAKATSILTTRTGSKKHKIVSAQEWLAARQKLLAAEKKFTRLRDQLNQQRRNLPWEKVEKNYVFDGPKGKETLAELFAGRSQLIVYHFMFDPADEEGCAHCSFWADNFNGIIAHVNQRDVTMLAVSRAPLKKLKPFKARLGWSFKWVSSHGSDFNYDLGVSFTEQEFKNGNAYYNYRQTEIPCRELVGISVFYKDKKEDIFHTYSCYSRGVDMLNLAYHYLDLVPKGRDEDPSQPQDWVDYHDKYPARA
jgi:predicted dithiol-disulfide oxidoreductase (DUF899 family)